MKRAMLGLVFVVACYRPSVGDCEYLCASIAPRCPGGLTCDGEGFCREPSAMGQACHDASVSQCTNPDAGVLNPESCQCDPVGGQQPCYLGDNSSASRCSAGGLVTCEATMRWGACTGATGPAQEICFDTMDSDCDGDVGNGCTCADASNVCLDATGIEYASERLLFVPSSVPLGGAFTMYVLSKTQLFNLSYQPDSGACTGAGFAGCTVGGRCAGWYVQQFSTTATGPFFTTAGTHTVTVHVGDTGNPGPCVNYSRDLTGSITITQ